MGTSIYPNRASVLKSLQTGTASSAGSITITAVDVTKTIVHSISTGSAGTVGSNSSINAANGSTSGYSFSGMSGGVTLAGISPSYIGYYSSNGAQNSIGYINNNGMNVGGVNVGLNTTSLTGGTTSLTAAQYGAVLTNSTTLTVSGPCTYQVVEYY